MLDSCFAFSGGSPLTTSPSAGDSQLVSSSGPRLKGGEGRHLLFPSCASKRVGFFDSVSSEGLTGSMASSVPWRSRPDYELGFPASPGGVTGCTAFPKLWLTSRPDNTKIGAYNTPGVDPSSPR